MNINSKMNKCPLCGREVHLEIKTSTVGSTMHLSEPCPCVNRWGKITCKCGLSLEREWLQIQAKDGFVLNNEDIFTVWNRLTGIREKLEAVKQAHLAAEKRNAELAEENERVKLEFAGFEEGTKHILGRLTKENEELRDTAYRRECELFKSKADLIRNIQERFSILLKKEYEENTPDGASFYFKNGSLMMWSIATRVFAQIAEEMRKELQDA